MLHYVLRVIHRLCNTLCMTSPTPCEIPQWDVTDRMMKAMRQARFTVGDMADYFDVSRNTVSGWLHGRIRPDTRTLRLWALHTDVPYEWLRNGT